ncbi:hypothetical protein TIFTF001_028824 [Ficus carica]|uniref:Uncharacterized protein n=1 Tax=Ficus carica TaxID=3494 RepID=A0AA88J222_FICCA|nr:hypothetical protein TIFTF001_028824 [Ficus carica]
MMIRSFLVSYRPATRAGLVHGLSWTGLAAPTTPWLRATCPSHISQSAAPAFHSIASEIAGRILTYSIDVRRELSLSKRSCTYLSRYVLRSAASPLGTAAGFLLLVEGHSQPKSTMVNHCWVNLALWAKPSNSGTIPGYGP